MPTIEPIQDDFPVRELYLSMSFTNTIDRTSTEDWAVVSLIVEAGISLYEGDARLAALQLGTAALSYYSSLLGALARVLIEVYKRFRTR